MNDERIPEDLDALDDNDDPDEVLGRHVDEGSVEQLELSFGPGVAKNLLVTPMMSLNRIKQLAGG